MTEICSRKRSDYLTRYDRATSSWKMSQVLLWENDPTFGTFSADFPRSGFMNADGTLYRLKMPKPRTNGKGGGASPGCPTPTPWQQQESIENWTERRAKVREDRHNGNGFGIPLDMAARMFPTPTSRDHKDSGPNVNWEPIAKKFRLAGVVQMLPTPRSNSAMAATITEGADPNRYRNLETVIKKSDPESVGGSLSPDWVSWLMGLPVKWTSLEPLPREEYLDWLYAQQDGTWWEIERGLPRVSTGIKDRVNRLKCLGNGIVPASLALFLSSR
jgi:hypothetical protein